MSDGSSFNRKTVAKTAVIAAGAALVPLAWARVVRARASLPQREPSPDALPRLSRELPKRGARVVRIPTRAQVPRAPAPEAPTPPPAAEAPEAPTPPPVAEPTPAPPEARTPEPVPEPPVAPPVPMPARGRQAPGEGPTPLHQWLMKHAPAGVRERVAADLRAANISLPFDQADRVKLCQIAVNNLPGELLDKLEDDHPEMVAELALCERRAEAPPVPAPAPAPPVEPKAAPPAPPVDEAPAPAPAPPELPAAEPAPAPAPPQEAPAPPPVAEAPPPPVAPPVPQPEVAPAPAPVPEAAPPAAQPMVMEGPKPPAGFDPALARKLAPRLAQNIAEKKYSYSRKLALDFQKAAGIDADKIYGGETRGALLAFGVRRPPRALHKPTETQPYKWADHV